MGVEEWDRFRVGGVAFDEVTAVVSEGAAGNGKGILTPPHSSGQPCLDI